MTKQEIFNIVSKHLLEQGSKSVSNFDSDVYRCMYRSKDGKKCAIGALIPDQLYDRSLEGLTVSDFFCDVNGPLIRDIGYIIRPTDIQSDEDALQYLGDLQNVHDLCPEGFLSNLLDFSKKYDLEFSHD